MSRGVDTAVVSSARQQIRWEPLIQRRFHLPVPDDGDAVEIWRQAMKMSHLAQFLVIILGGAAREFGVAMRRGLRRTPPQAR